MDREDKLKKLQNLTEQRFTKEVVIPLFEKMGFQDVTYYHGAMEYGKDVIFYETTSFGDKVYTGVQVKNTRIHTSAKGSGYIQKILFQAQEAFNAPFIDKYDMTKKGIDRVIILTSGEITDYAVDLMVHNLGKYNLSKSIKFIDGCKLISLIDQYMPSYFFTERDFFNIYFKYLMEEFKSVRDIQKLGSFAEHLALENIFVPLRLNLETVSEEEQIIGIDEALRRYKNFVILGDPGAGKTTLLKFVALKYLKENVDRQEIIVVPIPVPLHEFSISGYESLKEYAVSVLQRYNLLEPQGLFEKELEAGRCIFLLDGFDEIPNRKLQEKVISAINTLCNGYSNNKIILTSRIEGYRAEFSEFTHLKIMPFNDEEIHSFFNKWFAEKSVASDMTKVIFEHVNLNYLSRNPLMCSIIAIIFEQGEPLPERRAELCERCAELFLRSWDMMKGVVKTFEPEVKKRFFRKLAFHLLKEKKTTLSKKDLLEIIENYLPSVGYKAIQAPEFLEELIVRVGLLQEQSIDSYCFLNIIFQEYFAALELREIKQYSLVVSHIDDPWWRETLVLLAGIERDATEFIKVVRENAKDPNSKEVLLFLSICLADADWTDKDIKEEISSSLFDIMLKEKNIEEREKIGKAIIRMGEDIVPDISHRISEGQDVREKAKDIIEEMIKQTWKKVLNEKDSNRKGKALENLLSYILSTIEGFCIITRVRTQTEEIDIIVRNESKDKFWEKQGLYIILECKNWSEKVGKDEIVLFRDKLDNRFNRCNLGFLVSVNGFWSTINKDNLRNSKGDILIVPIDGKNLEKLVVCEDKSEILKKFFEESVFT